MAVSGLAAAKRLCQISDWSLSNLSIQKLLYIAHMFRLGQRGKPLVLDNFEAWDYGPVIPSVYHAAKIYGSGPVRNVFRSVENISEESAENKWLEDVYSALGDKTPGALVAITHTDNGAWAKNYIPGRYNIIISNEDILEEYRSRKI